MSEMSLFDLDELDRMISDVQGSKNDCRKKEKRAKSGLDELDKELQSFSKSEPKRISEQKKLPKNAKCFPYVYLSSSDPEGVTKANQVRACSALRCTSCDFDVLSFDDKSWHRETDYLFLRNNFPDRIRLMAKLTKSHARFLHLCAFYKIFDFFLKKLSTGFQNIVNNLLRNRGLRLQVVYTTKLQSCENYL